LPPPILGAAITWRCGPTNGRDWTWSQPAWPSKAAATSPTSGDAMVWAPSVVKGRDGRWWMYVSVGSEVWVGSAPAPGGPWADANHGRPLIPGNFRPGFHMIDAEAFIDRDGQAWLAWGSGLNWVNGHCFVVRLAADMVHFAGPVEDVTPAHYFEAPFLFRARDGYVLSYSAGNTTRDTYQVRYATGPSPRGPFTEAPNSPILQTQPGDAIISPGHHAFFRSGGRAFILYHRQALPWRAGQPETLRQVAVDGLEISPGPRLLVRGRWGPGAIMPGWPCLAGRRIAPPACPGAPWVGRAAPRRTTTLPRCGAPAPTAAWWQIWAGCGPCAKPGCGRNSPTARCAWRSPPRATGDTGAP
jgi:hypothetical protein